MYNDSIFSCYGRIQLSQTGDEFLLQSKQPISQRNFTTNALWLVEIQNETCIIQSKWLISEYNIYTEITSWDSFLVVYNICLCKAKLFQFNCKIYLFRTKLFGSIFFSPKEHFFFFGGSPKLLLFDSNVYLMKTATFQCNQCDQIWQFSPFGYFYRPIRPS